jgi:hypothetical protein
MKCLLNFYIHIKCRLIFLSRFITINYFPQNSGVYTSALKMDIVYSSETSVSTYMSTQRHNREHCYHRRENRIAYRPCVFFFLEVLEEI